MFRFRKKRKTKCFVDKANGNDESVEVTYTKGQILKIKIAEMQKAIDGLSEALEKADKTIREINQPK